MNKPFISDPATAKAIAIIDARAFALHAGATAALMGGNRELGLEMCKGLKHLKGICDFLEKEADTPATSQVATFAREIARR